MDTDTTSAYDVVPLFDYASFGVARHGHRVSDGALTVIDLETTGTYAPPHRIVEIGIVRMESGRVVSEYSSLVRPGRDVGPTHVHGIVNSDVRNAPTFADIAPDVLRLISNATVVAHFAAFEELFLAYEFALANIRVPMLPALCTRDFARHLIPEATHGLAPLCHRFGVPLIDAHSALGDARATARLLRELLAVADDYEQIPITTCTPLTLHPRHDAIPPLPREGDGPVRPGAGISRTTHAGWVPDPDGRHQWRWWNGETWTDAVADHGKHMLALPPHRDSSSLSFDR